MSGPGGLREIVIDPLYLDAWPGGWPRAINRSSGSGVDDMQSSANWSEPGYAAAPEPHREAEPAESASARVIPLFPSPGADPSGAEPAGDFDRDVYCLLGIPIDAVDMARVRDHVRGAAAQRRRCFLSTPNLNFLMGCRRDGAFRDSLINSDLNIVDGLPIAWMARRLGIPVRSRVTGSGLFETLMAETDPAAGRRLSVYFFGGPDGAARAAGEALEAGTSGLRCAGFQSPGFGSVEDMSRPDMIDAINASGADFLVVSLGARKGQAWIERNRHRLTVPVLSHLGAVVNFVAGTVDRAPAWVQRCGLEWLWRIKEEPALWRRYWQDGLGFLGVLFTRLLPYAVWLRLSWHGLVREARRGGVMLSADAEGCRLRVMGSTPDHLPPSQRDILRQAAARRCAITVDLSRADYLSPNFFGLLLVLRKHQAAAGKPLRFIGLSRRMARLFRWNGAEYLLTEAAPAAAPVTPPRLAGATSL